MLQNGRQLLDGPFRVASRKLARMGNAPECSLLTCLGPFRFGCIGFRRYCSVRCSSSKLSRGTGARGARFDRERATINGRILKNNWPTGGIKLLLFSPVPSAIVVVVAVIIIAVVLFIVVATPSAGGSLIKNAGRWIGCAGGDCGAVWHRCAFHSACPHCVPFCGAISLSRIDCDDGGSAGNGRRAACFNLSYI